MANTLRDAAIPFTKKKKKKKKKKQHEYKVPHNEEIAKAMQNSKAAFWLWKTVGRPGDPSVTYHEMKSAKKVLRRLQRQEASRKNCERIAEIMQSSSEDKQLFYQLINKQRSTNSRAQVTLKYNGDYVSNTHDVCQVWEKHFGSLVEATDDSDEIDIMAAEIKIIENHLSSAIVPEDYLPTIGEVRAAIHSLNLRKSPDSMGIMSEHLVYGGECVTLM